MGQTLTHGIYLPDEGERNCYNGLAGNWQLLDGAVGTVAEHTSQIAGKAPAVHTHTKSDITDFPVYGTTAGTICEGNDSRLSDARTPVAHTHGKADITDLFNSANTWTAQQIYSYYSTSYKSTGYEIGIAPSSNQVQFIDFIDKNNNRIGWFRRGNITDGSSRLDVEIFNRFSDGSLSPTGTELGAGFSIEFNSAGDASVRPSRPNAINLGTSTNKWKTFNGVNPGALSLPSGATENINTDNWNFSWSANTVTAPFDGYIAIACFGSALQINDETKAYAMTYAPGSDGYICGLLPVSSGDSIKVLVTRTQTSIYEGYKFIKASGNVS